MSNKPKNILFRTDSSSKIGIGHIMRDLVLAKQYPDAQIIFATQNLKGNINHKIIEDGYSVEVLDSNNISELNDTIQKFQIDMVVFDHYNIDYNFEKQLKAKNPKLKIMVLDDTYERHYCDILLNHNISADRKRYKNLVSKDCEIRCGSKHTLIRDEFLKEKKEVTKRKKGSNKKKTIFLAIGGADHSNINIKILKVLGKFNDLKINLVTTTANKNLKNLKEYAKNRRRIKLHINSSEIAKLIGKSDVAIVTPSVSANEVYFMKIPFIVIKTANNQDDMCRYLQKKKFLVVEKFKNKKFKKYVEIILNKVDKNVK